MFEGNVELHIVFPESPILQMALLVFALVFFFLATRCTSRSMATIAQTKQQLNEVTQRLATLQDALGTREAPPQCTDESSLHPSRSTSEASYHPRTTGQHLNHAIRRTRSFSAHVFTNGTRPIKNAPRMIRGQFTMMGREVLHPMRKAHHSAEPHVYNRHYSANVRDAPKSDQSSTESEKEMSADSDSSATAASSGPSSSASLSPMHKHSRAATHPRIPLTRRSAEMSLSSPSTPERVSRPAEWTTSGKNNTHRTTNKNGEPIRYARPARPEHSLPGVVFETRYENPLKSMFHVKPRSHSGRHSPKDTKRRGSLTFMKSSPSIRRLFGSTGSASDTCSERESSEDSDRSRRSSLSSTITSTLFDRYNITQASEAENAVVPAPASCGIAPLDAVPGSAVVEGGIPVPAVTSERSDRG
ncbi:hypothetical protein BC628DRAFT_1337208 [Trametes gibbosa]|nr:hypothetical protein BC628DRAFT_1337208 [Trametes gibbosa]